MSDPLAALTAHATQARELDTGACAEAAGLLADAAQAPGAKADFLRALARRGETAGELAAFADAFRGLARDPGLAAYADRAIDVCGTGGDHAGTFNVSTAAVFVIAAGGVPVIKHGNRSVTSRCGSADLLEAAGVRLELEPGRHTAALEQVGFTFLFAPAFHPAFRHIAPVRKQLAAEGQRTIFNLLGPLLNPARPAHQLLGVFSTAWVVPVAAALHALGLRAGLAVHGLPAEGGGVDEITVAGPTEVAGAGRLAGVRDRLAPEQLGLAQAPLAELAGGDAPANLALLEHFLAGRAPRALADTVCLNAGAALWIAGRATDLADGLAQARHLVDTGAAAAVLARARAFHRP